MTAAFDGHVCHCGAPTVVVRLWHGADVSYCGRCQTDRVAAPGHGLDDALTRPEWAEAGRAFFGGAQ